MAFFDPMGSAVALARAWRISAEQFADVAAQEMGGEAGAELDLTTVLTNGRDTLGPGRYETLLRVGTIGSEPLVTLTCPRPHKPTEHVAPTGRYLVMLVGGLVESHGLHPTDAVAYLADLDGVKGCWSAAEIVALVHAAGTPEQVTGTAGSTLTHDL
jgi:hypothetical protein